MTTFSELAKIGGSYFQRDLKEIVKIADTIEEVEHLTLKQRYTFCMMPINLSLSSNSNRRKNEVILSFARQLATTRRVHLPEDFHLDHPQFNRRYLVTEMDVLEEFHTILTCYLWLGFKFENSFVEYELCCLLMERVCDLINEALDN